MCMSCSLDLEEERHAEGTAMVIPFPSANGEIALVWLEKQIFCSDLERSNYKSRVFMIVNGRELNLPGEVWRGQTIKKYVSIDFKIIKAEDGLPYINVTKIEVQ